MPTIYGVVSGKGGVGKTTVAINLATCLHDFGHDVTLVDANTDNPNISLYLDVQNIPIALQHVLNENVNILHTVRVHHTGLKIIPSSVSSNKTDLRGLGEHLKKIDSTVIVDSAPGINENSENVIKAADKLIVVTTPDVPSLTDAVKAVKMAKKHETAVTGLVVNRVRNDRYELTSDEIEIMCEAPIIGRIPEDDEVRRSGFDCAPVVRYNPYAKSSVEYNYLTAKIFNKCYEPPSLLFLRRIMMRR